MTDPLDTTAGRRQVVLGAAWATPAIAIAAAAPGVAASGATCTATSAVTLSYGTDVPQYATVPILVDSYPLTSAMGATTTVSITHAASQAGNASDCRRHNPGAGETPASNPYNSGAGADESWITLSGEVSGWSSVTFTLSPAAYGATFYVASFGFDAPTSIDVSATGSGLDLAGDPGYSTSVTGGGATPLQVTPVHNFTNMGAMITITGTCISTITVRMEAAWDSSSIIMISPIALTISDCP